MVPHSWLKQYMMIFVVPENMRKVLVSSMEKWNTELESGGQKLGAVNIRKSIFQGDCLLSLLFVLALIHLTLVLRGNKAGCQLRDLWGKFNHPLFMDDLKLCGQSKKQIGTLVKKV